MGWQSAQYNYTGHVYVASEKSMRTIGRQQSHQWNEKIAFTLSASVLSVLIRQLLLLINLCTHTLAWSSILLVARHPSLAAAATGAHPLTHSLIDRGTSIKDKTALHCFDLQPCLHKNGTKKSAEASEPKPRYLTSTSDNASTMDLPAPKPLPPLTTSDPRSFYTIVVSGENFPVTLSALQYDSPNFFSDGKFVALLVPLAC